MDPIYSLEPTPLRSGRHVAIAIGIPTNPHQRHLGILHKPPDSDKTLMLHLAWHFKLCNEELLTHFMGVDLGVSPRRLRQVSASCRRIWKVNGRKGIPYGFSFPGGSFDEATGRFLLGSTKHGLTCSSFVLAVFHFAGLQLVIYDEWPTDRPEDRLWQETITARLERHPDADSAHIEALRSEIGAARFRPEEVAGAAMEAKLPVCFSTAVVNSTQILNALSEP